MEKLSSTDMSSKLKKFYAELRKSDGTFYAKERFITMRFGFQIYFLKRKSFDIVNSEEFKCATRISKPCWSS